MSSHSFRPLCLSHVCLSWEGPLSTTVCWAPTYPLKLSSIPTPLSVPFLAFSHLLHFSTVKLAVCSSAHSSLSGLGVPEARGGPGAHLGARPRVAAWRMFAAHCCTIRPFECPVVGSITWLVPHLCRVSPPALLPLAAAIVRFKNCEGDQLIA